jgi:LSD1 subclass zinc finger protein
MVIILLHQFQKNSPRRPLIVAGHCRRLLMLLRGADAAATELMLRAARVPPRRAAASLL